MMAVNLDSTWAGRTAKAILLIRVLVGWVFLSEGIQKFLLPDALGVGRFVKIGIPWPQTMAPFVEVVEIACGTLLLLGLLTRLATIPLLVDICVALYSTKIVTLAKNGIWSTLHEARTDVSLG
jgi:putative oxidoreductase